jgi:hypothetical protein
MTTVLNGLAGGLVAAAGAVRLAGARAAAWRRLRFRRLLAVHLVYGAMLGAWIRLTWLT